MAASNTLSKTCQFCQRLLYAGKLTGESVTHIRSLTIPAHHKYEFGQIFSNLFSRRPTRILQTYTPTKLNSGFRHSSVYRGRGLQSFEQTTGRQLAVYAHPSLSAKRFIGTKHNVTVDASVPREDSNSGWIMRLSNENTYLSWCRNSYIASVCGVAMYAHGTIASHAAQAAEVMLLAGSLNLVLGTGLFIYNSWKLRRAMNMHIATSIVHSSMAVLHMGLWLVAIMVFLGFVEESEEEMKEAILEDRRKQA